MFRNPMEVTKHCPKSCTQVQVAWLRLERLQSYAEKSLRKVLNTDRILMIEMGGFDPCRHCPDMINKQYLIRIIFRKHWWTLFEVKRPAEQNEMRFRGAIYTGFMAGGGILLISVENVPLVFPCMLQILIGVVQPCLYIMGKDSLKTY